MEPTGTSNEIKVRDILVKAQNFAAGLKRRWKLIICVSIIGALIGLSVSIFMKPDYTAVCTFVLEDNDNGGMLGQYAGLASLAGIELNNGSSIFKGDNIFELYRSRLMLEKTLLTETDFDGHKQRLIDRYIGSNKLLKKWKDKDHIDKIDFNADPSAFTRKQDSIITDITEKINKKYLEVSKPDKKLSVLKISFTSKDELFAKKFTDALVENVNGFYVQTKTKKAAFNVKVLQHQADSIKRALNASIYGVASALDAAPNANPALVSLRVPSQKRQVDVQANTAIYSEIVKNLELAKMSLRQQTPLIQYIDQPVLPLSDNHVGKVKGLILGAIAGCFFILCILFVIKIFRAVKNSTI